MSINRRDFLKIMGAAGLIPVIGCAPAARETVLSSELTIDDLAALAIRRLRTRGADYGDIRICTYRYQEVFARDRSFERLIDYESTGFGIRALYAGAWGFAAFHTIDEESIERASDLAFEIARSSATLRGNAAVLVPEEVHKDTWTSSFEQDPFDIPLDRKCDLVMEVTEKIYANPGISRVQAGMNFDSESKVFASTEGSFIKQRIIRSEPYYRAFATATGDTQSRGFESFPLNKGFEHILECRYLENAERVAAEAVEKVKASEGPTGVHKDLVLTPSHLWLTMHESVGHPTELDRVLGYEANYAGTSFATPDNLDRLRYGSKLVNLVADRTTPHARSTVGYDDEGVKTTRWDLVKDGIFVGYATNRETASILGLPRSTGCAYADSWRRIPIIRIPNIILQPSGTHSPTLEDIIADTKDGILIDGSGSYSIDQQRRNFQFGGDCFWEIKNGKRGRMLKNVTYHAMTTDFWGSCDAVGCEDEFRLYGTRYCGKGEPNQSGQMSTGSPPARFHDIEIGGGK